MLIAVAFAGCQETNPSMTIVSFQLDSDGEDTWIYLYSVPRVKMGNLTIAVGNHNETLKSVFSHQKHLSSEHISNISDDGYFDLHVGADLQEVFWEYKCKIRILQTNNLEEDTYTAEVIEYGENDAIPLSWNLPYIKTLEFKK